MAQQPEEHQNNTPPRTGSQRKSGSARRGSGIVTFADKPPAASPVPPAAASAQTESVAQPATHANGDNQFNDLFILPPQVPGDRRSMDADALRARMYDSVPEHPATTNGNTANHNHIGRLLEYHLKQTAKIESMTLANAIFSFIVASITLPLYPKPTLQFAGDQLSDRILFLSSVLIANFGLGFFAASETFNSFTSGLPAGIASGIQENYWKPKIIKALQLLGFGTLSAMASVPYAISTQGSPVEKALVLIGNTVMNLYAINNLVVNDITAVKNWLSRSPEGIAYRKLIAALNHTMSEVTYQVVQRTMNGQEFPPELTIQHYLDAEQPRSQEQIEEALVQYFANQAREFNIGPPKPQRLPVVIAKAILGPLGGGLVDAGLTGYILNVQTNLVNSFGMDEMSAGFATAGISFPLMYMGFRFGANTFMNVVDICTGNMKLSLAMQLHPKATVLLMVAIAGICGFSYATSVQMVRNNPYFKEGGKLHDEEKFFETLAGVSAFFFNNYACQLLGMKMIASYAKYRGKQDKQQLANFYTEMMDGFLKNVNESMTPSNFARSMEACTPFQRVALLRQRGINENVDTMLRDAQGITPTPDQSRTPHFFSQLTSSARGALRNGYDTMMGQRPANELYELSAEQRARLVPMASGTAAPPDEPASGASSSSGFWSLAKRITWPKFLRPSTYSEPEYEVVREGPPQAIV